MTKPFDPVSGSGTVGRVIGGSGRWFRISACTYDAATNKTICTTVALRDPNVVLNQHVSKEWHD